MVKKKNLRRVHNMNDRILVLSYYNPWVSGGGHRPICLAEQDINNGKQLLFCFESESEMENMEDFPLYNHKNLLIFRRNPQNNQIIAINNSAKNFSSSPMSDYELLIQWRPNYIRSHNPVENFIELLRLSKNMNIIHIYDQMDFWDAFPVQPWGTNTESEYIKLSTACVTISKYLQNKNPSFYLIPNGIKNSFLSKIHLNYDKIISRSKEKTKRIIYSGAIWPDWFDWSIVKDLIKLRPQYKFIFVGSYIPSTDEDDNRNVSKIVSDLSKYSNVEFLGQVSHEQIIPLLQTSHAAIIPFVVNSVTEACSPLKLYEYLGAFLPTVSTMLPEISGCPLLELANNNQDFIHN
jgi:glycosyltransferase involved in cell wall biosynthesis